MRISTSLSQQLSVNAMLNQQAKLAKTQLQLSMGSKILTPADDPSASARALDLTESIAVIGQYQANVETMRPRLALQDSALDTATGIVQRARELAVQGANDALNASDHLAIEKEVRELLDQMEGITNTQAANGEYIFSGLQSDVPAYKWDPTVTAPATIPPGYVFQADAQQRNLQIGSSRWLADGDTGDNVFGQIAAVGAPAASNGGTQNVLMTLYNFAEALAGRSSAVEPPTTPDTPQATISHTITNLDNALHKMDQARASIGARLNALDDQTSSNEKLLVDTRATLSGIEDLDYAEAIGRFNLQNTALQAAQQAYVKVQGLSLFNYLR